MFYTFLKKIILFWLLYLYIFTNLFLKIVLNHHANIDINTDQGRKKKHLQNETKITPYNIFMYFSFTYNSISTLVHLFSNQQSKGVCSARSYTNLKQRAVTRSSLWRHAYFRHEGLLSFTAYNSTKTYDILRMLNDYHANLSEIRREYSDLIFWQTSLKNFQWLDKSRWD